METLSKEQEQAVDASLHGFLSAVAFFEKKFEALKTQNRDAVYDITHQARKFFSSKEGRGKAFPRCSVRDLAQWLGRHEQLPEVDAACALLRTLGLLPDVREKNGSISSTEVFTHVPPLYDEEVFGMVHMALADPLSEYSWYNKVGMECMLISMRGDSKDVLHHLAHRLRELHDMAVLMRVPREGATLH